MKNNILIITLAISLLLLSACEGQMDTQLTTNTETSNKVEVEQETAGENLETDNAKQNEIPKPKESKPQEEKPKDEKKKMITDEIKTELKSTADFSEYPEVLLEGKNPSYKIIIGMDGPSTDVIAAIDITTSITAAFNAETDESLSIMDVKATSLTNNNYIIVGSPCWNRKTAEVLGLTYPTCTNTGLSGPEIRIMQNGEYHTVLVLGNTAEDIREAAQYLAKNNNLKGSSIKIS